MTEPEVPHVGAPERRAHILSQLRAFGFLSIGDLARDLRVSAMTVRRDLHVLESDGDVRLVHGGAGLSPIALHGDAFRRDAMAVARCRVAALAVKLVGAEDTIAVDAGMTAFALARALPSSFTGAVITHSMPVVQLFAAGQSNARLVVLGGELRSDRYAFVGPGTEAALADLRAKTFFLEPSALDERGIYAASPAEASVQRRLMEIADEVVIVATSAVLTGSAPALIAPLDGATRLVTDEPVPERLRPALRGAGLRVDVYRPCKGRD
jgi:DeoR/GlpR family transcriptional regulator of sugar metabolism